MFAHIGGRYADIKMAHDARIERAVEVHSDWGTFEWLVQDALEQGYRVGILANSDGHKGRHGASHPGASMFGAYGGLSCLLATGADARRLVRRAAQAPSLRDHRLPHGARHARDFRRTTPSSTADDPNRRAGDARASARSAMMGDILQSSDKRCGVHASRRMPRRRSSGWRSATASTMLETWRPYDDAALGRRIRVIWEGSEYRGRGRQTVWDGGCTLDGNSFERFTPINMWNLDKKIEQTGAGRRSTWTALTTGGFGGFDAVLADPQKGTPEDRYRAGEMRHRRRRHRARRSRVRGRRHQAPHPHLPPAGREPASHAPSSSRRITLKGSRRQRPLRLPHAGGRPPRLVEPDLRLSLTVRAATSLVADWSLRGTRLGTDECRHFCRCWSGWDDRVDDGKTISRNPLTACRARWASGRRFIPIRSPRRWRVAFRFKPDLPPVSGG